MADLARLVDVLSSCHSPALTWYGAERVELSGPVLSRWLAKTANLLLGELDPGLFGGAGRTSAPTIRIDLGPSWQGVVWEVAAGLCGWQLVDEGGADVGVVADASAAAGALAEGTGVVLAHDPAPLALSWGGGELPEGVLDALGELMAQSDALEVDPGGVEAPSRWGLGSGGGGGGGRRLLTVGGGGGGSHALVEGLVGTLVGLWEAGGSAVVVDTGVDGRDPARIAAVERARMG